MHVVRVTVLPRAVLLDPEGETIEQAARRLGYESVRGVRAGRAFMLQIAAETPQEALEVANRFAQQLLHNPVVETYELSLVSPSQEKV
ncbi:MAG: phosphoribosylformylglycinamidine synthase subunit PurS [Bacteroidia bacterium]|nr:phosphoribosylformylglycinamidine synthase subunit PurS [Bacteroidia bacterium]